jgi:hypothetical protein
MCAELADLRASTCTVGTTSGRADSAVWSASLGLTSLQVPAVCDME